ncbi:MAG TPA: MFS transporter [Clostridia bacterium]|nr:MFS transporter [Clostridia bacterium]
MRHTSKWVQYIGFISVGIIANIIGPLLPAIRTDININYSQGGLLLSGQFVGMLITALIGGYFMDKSGKRPFMLAGSAMIIVGLAGSMTAKSFMFLYALNLITGFGYGIYEVGINALCADSSEENKGSDMNFLHFFYGVGAIAAPLLAFASTEYLGNWKYCFGFALIAPVIVSILLIRNRIEEHKLIHEKVKKAGNKNSNPYKSLFLWTAGLTAFFYVGVEVSTGGWISVYWNTMIPDSAIPASLTATIFWLCLTVGRLFSGKIADRIGLSKYMLAAGFGTLLLSALWSVLPAGNWTLVIVGVLGLMLSGQYPTAMAIATAHFPGKSGVTAAFISVFAGLSGFFIPALIGRAADTFSIAVLSYAMLVLSLLLVIFAYTLKKGSMQS